MAKPRAHCDPEEIVAFAVAGNAASRAVMHRVCFTFELEFEREGLPCSLYRRRAAE